MSDTFDPYHKWLGIPPEEQPPHHYRLLGITLFEADREVIEAAANRQMSYLQELSSGAEQIDEAQKLLGEVSRARICLRDAEKKNEYDAQLREELTAANEEFVAEESSEKTTTFAAGDGSAAESPVAVEGIHALPGSGPDVEAGGGPLIPLPDGMKAIPHTTAHPRGKKQNPMPLIVLAVVALVLIGGGITFYLTGEAKKQEQQRLAQRAERKAAEEEEDRRKAEEKKEAALQAKQAAAARKRKAAAARKKEADRKATEEAERKAQEEAELKKKQKTERKVKEKEAQEKAKREAVAALAALKLERQKGEKGEPIWYLQNDEADQYKKLQEDHTAEQIEPLEASREALLQEYAKLDEDPEVKKHLQQVGGVLATENDLPFWPDEVLAELKESGLLEHAGDDHTVWILADEAKFLESIEGLDEQKDEFFKLRTKGKDKKKAGEKAKEFGKDFESVKAHYKTLSQKYEELDGKDELIAKIESLGNRLGPSLTAVEWQKKQRDFAKVVKTSSRSKSGGRLPKPIYVFNKTLTFDGNQGGQDAIPDQIRQPPVITAEVIVRVNRGEQFGQIVGQAVDRRATEQGWQLGYGEHVFEWRIATRGQKFAPQAYSKPILWHKAIHVVGTYDGRTMKLYVNGQLVDTKKVKGQGGAINYPPSTPFIIGAYKDMNGKNYFELDGTIFLVRVYNGPLTDAQVAARYNEVKEKIDKLNNAP